MKDILILSTFTFYPDGSEENKEPYPEGADIKGKDDETADLFIKKGLAKEIQAEQQTTEAE